MNLSNDTVKFSKEVIADAKRVLAEREARHNRLYRGEVVASSKEHKPYTEQGAGSPYHFDDGKPRTDLIPPFALLQVAEVFEYGSKKYGDRNWEQYADDWTWGQLIGSALRHIFRWMTGEDVDPESGKPHLAHATVNLLMLLELTVACAGKDDRSRL